MLFNKYATLNAVFYKYACLAVGQKPVKCNLEMNSQKFNNNYQRWAGIMFLEAQT